jgi:phage tail sheath protein FI
MSEYLAPGVFVEEVSFQPSQIQPASTSIAGMVGPTRFGPAGVAPQLLTSFNDFLTYFGDATDLAFSDGAMPNYSAYAAQTFFDNGGQQLYFARVYNNVATPLAQTSPQRASLAIPSGGASSLLTFTAQFLGSGGNLDVVLQPRLSQPLLQFTTVSVPAASTDTQTNYLLRVTNPPTAALVGQNLPPSTTISSLMAIATHAPAGSGTGAAPDQYNFLPSQPIIITDSAGGVHIQQLPATGAGTAWATGIIPTLMSPGVVTAQTVSLQVVPKIGAAPVYSIPVGANLRSLFSLGKSVSTLYATVNTTNPPTFSATPGLNPGPNSSTPNLSATISGPLGLLAMGSRTGDGNIYYCSYDVSVQRNGTTIFSAAAVDLDSGANNSLAKALPQNPTGSAAATQPLCAIYNGTPTGATLWPALFAAFDPADLNPTTPGVAPSLVLHVGQTTANTTAAATAGTDGASPQPVDYSGADAPNYGLAALESIDAVSIVICPAAAADPVNHQAVVAAMIAHCTKMLYRVAVIDSPKGAAIGDVQTFRSLFSDTRTALYYPWVSAASLGPTGGTILLPPSSFVAGLYAYTDITRGVHKAPANVVVQDALGLELSINTAQQEVLNPIGINCLRQFTWGGFRVWGARTLSSDPQWQYVNVRRYFLYLEHSLQSSTSWVVFEPNGQALWSAVATTVSDFLYNEWREGHLFGATPAQAFFVRCDTTTMTQADLDNGRLICVIGVAPLEPAEFVIFRIGQYTASSTS